MAPSLRSVRPLFVGGSTGKRVHAAEAPGRSAPAPSAARTARRSVRLPFHPFDGSGRRFDLQPILAGSPWGSGAHFIGLGRFHDPCYPFHFWSPHPARANFPFGDGSVRFLPYFNCLDRD
jgi:hypothetical protein